MRSDTRINKKDFAQGVSRLKKGYRLFGPQKEGTQYAFRELSGDRAPDLTLQNTRLSPKSLVYPQTGVLFSYSLDPQTEGHHVLEPALPDKTPRAVIGIRPCDASAFLLVKRNFDAPDYKDPYWLAAYENTTFVGLACQTPCQTCFCTSAGSGPFDEKGLDLLLADLGNEYGIKVLTPKGETLMKAAGWDAAGADSGVEKELAGLKAAAEAKITAHVATDRLRDQATLELYEAGFWEDIAFACINCGTCTYLCPTCWCFDIQDETCGAQGQRLRNWDSCMFPLFTKHGSGHNPRPEKTQRVRQRFMHKLKYYPDKYGDGIQCVGCGRCIQYCPVNIDIRKVCNLMNSLGQPGDVCELAT